MKTKVPIRTAYPREFTSYAKANGRTPGEQLEHDNKEFPGGCMAGFISWMSSALGDFRKRHPEAHVGDLIHDHNAKNKFLAERAESQRLNANH